MQNYLLDILLDSGEKFDLKLVGARAQNWLDKKNPTSIWVRFGKRCWSIRSNLSRFVDINKEFLGKSLTKKEKMYHV